MASHKIVSAVCFLRIKKCITRLVIKYVGGVCYLYLMLNLKFGLVSQCLKTMKSLVVLCDAYACVFIFYFIY